MESKSSTINAATSSAGRFQFSVENADAILKDGDGLKVKISTLRRHQMNRIHDESVNVKTALVYLNILQESQELVSSWRHLLRASRMFQ